jgi:hypothetical protein
MQRSFLQSYLGAFQWIEGWFSYDAALMFMAYNQLISAAGISGDVLEIGVHHGLSAIAIATLRGAGRRLYGVDLFEKLQSENVSGSGRGNHKMFEQNMKSFFGEIDFIELVTSVSGTLRPGDLPRSFSFCHVDGGHSPGETYADLKLASDILIPGGLLALDDYFNPQFPGVCEGAVEFMLRHQGVLRPVAIGYNKVLFQRSPEPFDLAGEFSKTFPEVEHLPAGRMWNSSVFLFGGAFRDYFDLYASKPERLVPLGAAGTRAAFSPDRQKLTTRPEEVLSLPVRVNNSSSETFPHGDKVFGLSYHLLSAEGKTIQHDNTRTYLRAPLQPREQVKVDLRIAAPSAPGRYGLEIDLVWEDVMWFKDVGNPTCVIELEVG